MVLPEPDSPTTPTVSPSRTAIDTPSTALTWPTVRFRKPRRIGNQTLDRAGVDDDRRARGHRLRPALRLGGEQPLRVGMARALEHLGDRTLLDDLALRHDADPVGDLAHDAEVVGDEQHRHAEARFHFGEELQDLRLHGDVERRRRLVGDEQVGLVGERHRDHDALALPARELVRIGVEPARRHRAGRPGRAARACARAPPAPTARGAASGSRRPAARSCAAG